MFVAFLRIISIRSKLYLPYVPRVKYVPTYDQCAVMQMGSSYLLTSL